LFLKNILLNNYRVLYLINIKEILNLSTFINIKLINVIKTSITNFLVLRHRSRIIKKIFTKVSKENTINLLLKNVVIIKGFYTNIVSESYLRKVKI
jgi:hypothetical protein